MTAMATVTEMATEAAGTVLATAWGMTGLGVCLSPQFTLAFRPTADTVLMADLISMSEHALVDRLLSEAARNPALIVEVREPGPKWTSGNTVRRTVRRAGGPAATISPHADRAHERAAREHPAERLVADAALALRPEDRPLALEIAYGLDRRGFLTSTPEELALSFGAAGERVARVLDVLRASGPEGIATAGPRECVIAQLRALEPPPGWRDLAIVLMTDAFEEIALGRLDVAAREIGFTRGEVEVALAGMVGHVRPYPDWDPPDSSPPPARADVIVDLVGERLVVRLAEDEGLTVRIDERLRADDPRLARAAREAEAWASRVKRRRGAVLAVAQATIARQEPAMRLGLSQLRPLTRRAVADMTGLPESTVSRVVSDRILRTPSGRLLPFAALFGAALDALSVLGRLVSETPPPQSDRALAVAMAAAGHPVARRTVAKYRAKLGIAPLRSGV